MSLTLEENGTYPIAKVVDSDGDPYYVYLNTGMEEVKTKTKSKAKKSLATAKLDPYQILHVKAALETGLTIEELYKNLSLGPERGERMLEFKVEPGEKIEILPSDKPERLYAAGPTGAGKTWVVAQYARNYHKLFPKNQIILFARQANDPAFKGLTREEIVLDAAEQEKHDRTLEDLAEEIKERPLQSYSNSLVIFDDVDNLMSKVLLKQIHSLNNDLMCNGRKQNINVAYIGHIMLNAHQTKVVLNEASKVFFFSGTGARGVTNFLKTYAEMEKGEIAKIKAIKDSRWIMLNRSNPRYVATEKSIFLI